MTRGSSSDFLSMGGSRRREPLQGLLPGWRTMFRKTSLSADRPGSQRISGTSRRKAGIRPPGVPAIPASCFRNCWKIVLDCASIGKTGTDRRMSLLWERAGQSFRPMNRMGRPTFTSQPRRFKTRGAELSKITQTLSTALGRTVVDGTGLKGRYNVSLSWDEIPGMRNAPGAESSLSGNEHGSLFTAVEEQ